MTDSKKEKFFRNNCMNSMHLLLCELEKPKTQLIPWIGFGSKEKSIADCTIKWSILTDIGIDGKQQRDKNLLQMTESK